MKMKSFYFTFGCGHPLRKFVQRIFASCKEKARETMRRFYADKWAFCYGPYDANDPMDYETGMVDLHGYKYRKIEEDLMEDEAL